MCVFCNKLNKLKVAFIPSRDYDYIKSMLILSFHFLTLAITQALIPTPYILPRLYKILASKYQLYHLHQPYDIEISIEVPSRSNLYLEYQYTMLLLYGVILPTHGSSICKVYISTQYSVPHRFHKQMALH